MATKPTQADAITQISLERPASVRRLLPSLSAGWVVPDYIVGPENEGLRYLFDDETVLNLASHSPVVFYGDKFLGKTALAITLAVRWSRSNNLRPLCFTTGAAFVTDFSAAVEIDDIDSFRKRHRDCKMLVVDDLEALASKPAAQDELASTLDHLSELGRPVIVSVSRLPAALRGIKPRLASRLNGGYSIAVAKPGTATRAELMKSLIAAIDSKLPVKELTAVADQLGSSSPLCALQLKDLVTIAHQNRVASDHLDLAVVAKLAGQHLSSEAPTIASIAKLVARKLRVKLVDLRGSTREASVVRARGLAMLLSREFTAASLQQVGQFFGGRDHSTVLHACRKTARVLETDSELANSSRELRAELLQ